MCYAGKCLCIKVETGSLIFGVITAVINAIGIVFNVSMLIGINCFDYSKNRHFDAVGFRADAEQAFVISIFLGIGLIKGLIDFLFAVLLCDGVCKKKASYVKAYFIYGVVMSVLSGLAIFVIFWIDLRAGALFLSCLVLYCMILHMINLTQVKLAKGEVYQFQHKRLVETIY